jgi:hypothetical protein
MADQSDRNCVVPDFHRIANGLRLAGLQYVAISGLLEGSYAETKLGQENLNE